MKRRGRPPYPDILTPREWEVLGLLRAGLSNEQIAERLGISLQGAKFHVSEILGKLQVTDRVAAARWQPPAQRPRVAPALAPLAFLRRRVGLGWRVPQAVLKIAAAAAVAVVIGAVVAATVLIVRWRGGAAPAAGGLTIGKDVELPLLLDGDRLAVSSLDGGTPAAFTPPGNYTDVQFDAEGRIVYFVYRGAQTGFYRVEGAAPRRVIPVAHPVNEYSIPTSAAWSPDGSRAAWIETDGRLRIAEPDGNARVIALDGVTGLFWAPDSVRLMAWSDAAHVWIVDARSGATTATVAQPPDAWSVNGYVTWLDRSIPPDGNFVGTIFLAREDGSGARALGIVHIPTEGFLPTPSFSPDDRYVAFSGARSADAPSQTLIFDTSTGGEVTAACPVCVSPALGGALTWLPTGVSDATIRAAIGDGTLLAVSPDGSRVAYDRRAPNSLAATIYTRAVEGGAETRVAQVSDDRALATQLAWARDGSQLVVPLQVAESNTMYTFDPKTGDVSNLGSEGPATVPALLAPDGSAYYDGLSVRSLSDGRVLAAIGGEGTDWSSDSRRMLAVQGGLFEVDLATGGRSKLLDGNVQDAVWSPDGRRIAFIRDQKLGVLDVASGETKMIAPDLTAMWTASFLGRGYLAWSPDGTRIAVGDWTPHGVNGAADLYLVDPGTGARTRLTDAPASYRYYRFSPDGRWLAYFDQDANSIAVMHIASKTAARLASIDSASFAWASDSQLFATTADGIALLNADGSSRLVIANTGGCDRVLIGWAAPRIVFSSRCTHQGL